jgi:L-fucose isomerase-like protein
MSSEEENAMTTEHKCKNLLLFGGVHTRYLDEWAITDDLALAESKLDVQFDTVPMDDLVTRYASLDEEGLEEATHLAEGLVDAASPELKRDLATPPPFDEIVKATRLYVAMRQFAEAHESDAVTIICGPWIRGEDRPVPCVALMLFQERGIPAACQSDIDALLTMVLFKRVAGVASFMGGAIEIGDAIEMGDAIEAQDPLGINHCILCRNMPGPSTALQPYVISTYHGRKDSPTVWVDVPTGETVTVARLTQNLERLLLFAGPVVANQTHNTRCRNTLVVPVPDRERVFDAVQGVQNHYVVAFGDHTRALAERAAARGIEVVRLDVP